jgi:hypothetical protein
MAEKRYSCDSMQFKIHQHRQGFGYDATLQFNWKLDTNDLENYTTVIHETQYWIGSITALQARCDATGLRGKHTLRHVEEPSATAN